ncbi:MAG: hypothetical protein GTN86_06505 [Xanthomonadales bacterium]|nr:hypothetical protein [Xanthomonadales bacterium]NIN59603.1 hypothetical protein [Xanthomonadales bacterium]NIN75007.1 hypothetical protein [Xanthomonadales bacterium]NIO14101.1 hypothetical protein [Xanthomonadales bacterium]NIP11996.1 hypothetical protein [Xanthomonadales bacterium]
MDTTLLSRSTPECVAYPVGAAPSQLRVIASIEDPLLIVKILGYVRRCEQLTGIEARGPPGSEAEARQQPGKILRLRNLLNRASECWNRKSRLKQTLGAG